MTQKDNILQELQELNSNLINLQQNVYTVPAGYFDGLAEQVMSRIKAQEAKDAAEELSHLSPLLSKISKESSYSVPAGYFEGLAASVLNKIREGNDYQTAAEELESLSPMLSGLKKDLPYSVPAGYFDNLTEKTIAEENKPAAKVISFSSRKWIRYAAAAVVTGIIVLAGFLIFGNNGNGEPGSKIMAKISRDIKKMNTEQQDDLIDFIDAGMNGKETAQEKNTNKSAEIQDLLKGISDEELLDFQQQSEDIQAVLLVN
jgi:hypothetical protein